MDQLVEISRLLQNLLRFGTIASVDHAARRCTVKTGGLVTRPMRWLVMRAGDARTSWAPSLGEQVMVLCPGGDPARGAVLPALYGDATPSVAGSDTANVTEYPDGAVISYDPQAHQLTASLPDGGKASVIAPGGLSIKGDTSIDGKLTVTKDTDLGAKLHVASDVSVDTRLTAQDDVTGGGVSVKNHPHDKTQPGTGVSGKPVAG